MLVSEITEASKIAFESLKANKMRSFLAMLGIVIGISFVVIMGWALSGLDAALEDTINIIGSDMLYVEKWQWAGGGHRWHDDRNRKDFHMEQARTLIDRVKGADVVFPSIRRWGGTVAYGDKSMSSVNVMGTTSDYGRTSSGAIQSGRFFSAVEDQFATNAVVVGFNIKKNLFPDEDPLGKELKIGGRPYQIVGVVEKRGTLLMDFVDNQVFLPLNTFAGQFGISSRSVQVGIKAKSIDDLPNLREEVRGIMRSVRNLKPYQDDDFGINESQSMKDEVATLRTTVWSVGIGLTCLSFLVGIIGIMNIMFVSVAERTKEIGIRKAIGAPNRSILTQFLVESSTLCLIGAGVSLVLCSIFIFLIATILPKFVPTMSFLPKFISFQLLFIASAVSIFVGVLAGFVPAYKAAKLDPVEALRYD